MDKMSGYVRKACVQSDLPVVPEDQRDKLCLILASLEKRAQKIGPAGGENLFSVENRLWPCTLRSDIKEYGSNVTPDFWEWARSVLNIQRVGFKAGFQSYANMDFPKTGEQAAAFYQLLQSVESELDLNHETQKYELNGWCWHPLEFYTENPAMRLHFTPVRDFYEMIHAYAAPFSPASLLADMPTKMPSAAERKAKLEAEGKKEPSLHQMFWAFHAFVHCEMISDTGIRRDIFDRMCGFESALRDFTQHSHGSEITVQYTHKTADGTLFEERVHTIDICAFAHSLKSTCNGVMDDDSDSF